MLYFQRLIFTITPVPKKKSQITSVVTNLVNDIIFFSVNELHKVFKFYKLVHYLKWFRNLFVQKYFSLRWSPNYMFSLCLWIISLYSA